MSNINLKNTERNKDANFALTKATDGERFTFSEAVAVENGDESISIYGFCEKAGGVEVWGDTAFSFQPMLLGVEIPLKDSEFTSKAGKVYKTTCTIQHKAIIHKVRELGFSVPFSCELDMGVDADAASIILTGVKQDGSAPNAKETTYVEMFALPFEKLEALVKMKDIPVPTGKSGKGAYSGGGGQKEAGKLDDRMSFILKAARGENADLEAALSLLFPSLEAQHREATVTGWLSTIMR